MPFSNQEVMARLEDLAAAANIPRVAVFDLNKGFESFVKQDVKHTILRNQSSDQAAVDVLASLD